MTLDEYTKLLSQMVSYSSNARTVRKRKKPKELKNKIGVVFVEDDIVKIKVKRGKIIEIALSF